MGQLNCFRCNKCGAHSKNFEFGTRIRSKNLVAFKSGKCPICGEEGYIEELIVMNYD